VARSRLHCSVIRRLGRSSVRLRYRRHLGRPYFYQARIWPNDYRRGNCRQWRLIGSDNGAIVGGKAADLFGRRRVLLVTASIFGIGALASAVAPSPARSFSVFLTQSFAIMRFPEVKHWTNRDDSGRINLSVRHVIVALNVIETDSAYDAWLLI